MLRGLRTDVLRQVLVFVLGLGLGAWSMRLYFDRTVRRWDPQQRLVEQLGTELGLSGGQKDKVAAVLGEEKARVEARRSFWESDVRLLSRDGEDGIERILAPDQVARFSALHDDIHGAVERYLWVSQDDNSAIAGVGR